MISSLFYVAAILLGGMLVAWAIENVVPAVVKYLKSKFFPSGFLIKGDKINDLIRNSKDPEIRAELEAVKKAHDGLLLPTNDDQVVCYGDITLIRAQDPTGKDQMTDECLIRDDGTYQEF